MDNNVVREAIMSALEDKRKRQQWLASSLERYPIAADRINPKLAAVNEEIFELEEALNA